MAEKRSANLVSFKNVTVRVNGNTLIENINATVPSGKNTVLIGPNGAGKSTLLHCMTGECEYSGQIELESGTGQKVRIGYVPQQVFVEKSLPLTVTEFIAAGLQRRPIWLGISQKMKENIRHILSLAACAYLADKSMGYLSGGELRKVFLATALSRKPDLLLLDEPDAGVDAKGEKQIWESLERLRELFGFTELVVSHNLSLASQFANWVICIDKTVIAEGTPVTVVTPETLERLFGISVFC